jgi:hypothetical protein
MAPIGAIVAFISSLWQYARLYLSMPGELMRVWAVGLIGVAGLLAACGGGDSNGGTNPAAPSVQQQPNQLPSGPKTYVAAQATVDDYYTFKRSTYQPDGIGLINEIAYSTRLVTNAAADGSRSWRYLDDIPMDSASTSFGTLTFTSDFDSVGRRLAMSSSDCVKTPSTPYHLVAPYGMAPGTTSQYAGVDSTKCSGPSTAIPLPVAVSFTDRADAMEQVTVPAGTFNAIKVSRTGTAESNADIETQERTCWWEPDLGIEVKCTSKTVRSWKPSGPSFRKTETLELLGYSNKKLARKVDSVQRFVGPWKGRFDGVASGKNVLGTCRLEFDTNGDIKGSCGGSGVLFDVIGTAFADGRLVFSLSKNNVVGQTIVSKINDIQQVSGTWEVPSVGSGTWSISQ